MFPFDSSNDVLALLIPAILLLYAIILVKLKPSEDNGSQPNTIQPEAQRLPLESEILRNPTTVVNVRKTSKQLPSDSEINRVPKQIIEGNAQNQQIEVEQSTKLDEHTRDKRKKKSFFLYGEQDFGGCRHKPGHLSTVPKNTPIPEECFGCPEILECMKYKTK